MSKTSIPFPMTHTITSRSKLFYAIYKKYNIYLYHKKTGFYVVPQDKDGTFNTVQ
jgi:hypothetical protein